MAVDVSRDGAVRRRRGAVARVAYAIRKARRVLRGLGLLSDVAVGSKGTRSVGDALTPSLCLLPAQGAVAPLRASDALATDDASDDAAVDPVLPVSAPSVPRVSGGALRRGGLSFPPARRGLDAATTKDAIALIDDFTDCGSRSVVMTVRLRCWRRDELQCVALSLARGLDVLPRERCPAAWTDIVCSLFTYLFADVSPEFERVWRRAADAGVSFSAVPLRGRWGWQRRARIAGFL